MKDVNEQLWKVGVTAKTQHNEVAPAQHELAPIYAEANIAVDHNQIVMQTLKRVACQSRPQPDRNADIEESCVPAWAEMPAP